MQRDRQLDDTQIGGEMSAGFRYRFNQYFPHLAAKLPEFRFFSAPSDPQGNGYEKAEDALP